ncbi:MAG: Gfo/Idh/MocA family oxidoreductase [Planctomycetes bacterium]|jgi:predicted dehydrogenase|nr:Gfo/Idh/MocA family oxidoreductase [Planctomycetota bacterium]
MERKRADLGATWTADRRQFLRQTGAVLGTAALAGPAARAVGANERILLGMIGPGGQGSGLLRSFVAQKDVEVAYVCDVDAKRLAAAATTVEKAAGKAPQAVKDMRRIFDDGAVDAVVIATPDHWHAPATILACDAGKHVYVEKPCSHNIREGRLMIEAARRSRRIVQVGTQTRSAEHVRRAIELLHSGAIGDVLAAKVWNSQLRANIGHAQPSDPPAHLDFDLWVGPAPLVPYQSNLLPSIWRWWYAFGAGDIGNDGVHDLDLGRWGLGVETHPATIAALGGKYFFDDDQQFPDTQTVVFEYAGAGKKKQLIFEQRIWSPYVQEGFENGNAFYGTKGMMLLCKQSGWQLFGPRNKPGEAVTAKLDSALHHRNFLACIRSGARPNADIEIGHLSTTLAHLGNIATRVGRVLHFDPATEQFAGDEEANRLVRRTYREGHWGMPKGV